MGVIWGKSRAEARRRLRLMGRGRSKEINSQHQEIRMICPDLSLIVFRVYVIAWFVMKCIADRSPCGQQGQLSPQPCLSLCLMSELRYPISSHMRCLVAITTSQRVTWMIQSFPWILLRYEVKLNKTEFVRPIFYQVTDKKKKNKEGEPAQLERRRRIRELSLLSLLPDCSYSLVLFKTFPFLLSFSQPVQSNRGQGRSDPSPVLLTTWDHYQSQSSSLSQGAEERWSRQDQKSLQLSTST